MIMMLTPQQVAEQWSSIRPMLDAACRANEIAYNDLEVDDLYIYTQTDKAFVLAMYDEHGLGLVLVIQPTMCGDRKCADMLAMGGRRLLHFKAKYWESIKDWLRVNDFKMIDSYASERLAKIYSNKFGFTKSAVVIRQEL